MVERVTQIEKFLCKGKSVFVLGPRSVGKSYYLKSVFGRLANSMVLDLLSRETYERYLREPQRFYEEVRQRLVDPSSSPLYVLVDEIQLLPSLLFEVHRLIEDYKGRCVFALTGSSARKLKGSQADLLAGRALGFRFFPLTSDEADFDSNLDRILQFGTMPEIFLEGDTDIVVETLRSYASNYLQQEIKQESIVRNLSGFSRFLELSAFSNGEPVNYSNIARAASVSPDTVKEYYQILEDTLLGTMLPAWDRSVRKQLTKAPKFYFFDTGVINALRGELRTETKKASYRYGRLFETMVVNEVLHRLMNLRLDFNAFHYRTNHGQEIDLILQANMAATPIAIDIKSSSCPNISDVRPMLGFAEAFSNAKLLVLCTTPRAYNLEGIDFLPWQAGLHLVAEAIGQ